MTRVFSTTKGWCCLSSAGLTYYTHLSGAMDAAYRQANSDGTSKQSNSNRSYG